MKESSEEKGGAINSLPEGEREQLQSFLDSLEGKQKIGKMFEKLPEAVTESDAVLAYEKLGVALFSKEERLDDMSAEQRSRKEKEWKALFVEPVPEVLKMPQKPKKPPFQKAA